MQGRIVYAFYRKSFRATPRFSGAFASYTAPVNGRRLATIPDDCNGLRLDRALSVLFPEFSRSFLAKLIEAGHVAVDTERPVKASHRVAAGQTVAIDIPPNEPASIVSQEIPLTILFEDSDLVVIDKPPGLVVHPAAGHPDRTLVNALLFHVRDLSGIGGELRPGIVHRLDKDTSGVMVIAKNDEAHRTLTSQWNSDAVRKEYLALVYGTPSPARGTVDAPIGRDPRDRKRMAVVARGRRAWTDYEVVEPMRHVSLVRCILRTGRTHQIRVHMKHIGHPIVGDPVYSGPQWRGIPDPKVRKALASLGRQALHAARITIPHPRSGESLQFEAPLPDDLRKAIGAIRQSPGPESR
ncbi:MAG TPA: RluA family pseudouridine synthase [Thermoanaerobaculia bacterium]|nr:RluA family pseudouridine synthase [Thermoanaerobaculia bacterium]